MVELGPAEGAAAALAAAAAWEPTVEAFIDRNPDAPHDAARATGPLGGMPVTVKDNIAVAGRTMTAGSSWWRATPQEDAAAWQRLRRAGAVLVGRVNLHEFAYGASTVNARSQTTRNPWSPDRIAGGSSGGSAVSVAIGAAAMSLGTDTGGSVRIPAALCGVTGFKPTHGVVSTAGVLPLSPTCDHVGVLAPGVAGCRSAWAVIADRAPGAAAAGSEQPVLASLRGVRVGLLREHLAAADPDVATRVAQVVDLIRDQGGLVDDLVLPQEAAAGAATSDVVAFEAAQLHRAWLDDPASEYDAGVRARLERGRALPAPRYLQATRERTRLATQLRCAQRAYDVVLGPTVQLTAPTVDAVLADEGSLQARLLRNTYLFNVTGQPAISLPCGTDSAGLPIGVQLAAARGRDTQLLAVSGALESVLDGPLRRPRLGTAP
jgi:aspartyl-tRNA(Asn)/glutamyl-tRNA(Gln) amidotransferase subunit A